MIQKEAISQVVMRSSEVFYILWNILRKKKLRDRNKVHEIKTKPKRTHKRQSPIILKYILSLMLRQLQFFPCDIFHANLRVSEQCIYSTLAVLSRVELSPLPL